MERIRSFFTRWNPTDCKSALMASGKRAQMMRNKNLVQQRKLEKEISEYLAVAKDEKARIKAETLLRLQKTESAYDILETLIELIQTRIDYLTDSKECPVDLVTPLASIIYACKRLQVSEFKDALRQFNAKYGVSFTNSHADNNSGQVSANIIEMTAVHSAKEGEIYDLLVYVAQKNNIEWVPPVRPITMADRQKDADPLMMKTGIGILGAGPVMVNDPTPKNGNGSADEAKPAVQATKPFSYADDSQNTQIPPKTGPDGNPVSGTQYDDLMHRLRNLNNDNPSSSNHQNGNNHS